MKIGIILLRWHSVFQEILRAIPTLVGLTILSYMVLDFFFDKSGRRVR